MILGITGAFGCGKSTLLALLKKYGFETISADAVCHSVYAEREPEFFAKIAARFGTTVFDAQGALDRGKMAAIVFRDPAALDDLTALLLPRLKARIDAAVAAARSERRDLAVEIPLLYETGFDADCDKVVAIACDPEIRRERLRGRGFDAAEIARRDARQLPPETKLEKADYGLVNNGGAELLSEQLHTLMGTIKPYRNL